MRILKSVLTLWNSLVRQTFFKQLANLITGENTLICGHKLPVTGSNVGRNKSLFQFFFFFFTVRNIT